MRFSEQERAIPVIVMAIAVSVCLSGCRQDTGPQREKTPVQSEQNRKMKTLLADIYKKEMNPDNPYASARRIAFCDSVIASTRDQSQQLNMQFVKAVTLLEYGDEAQSVALYEELLKHTAGIPEARKQVLSGLGIAYLRLGERNNCVSHHASEACIMPIRGNGIHQDKAGARKAVGIYETMLKENPGDLDSRWLLNIAYMTLGEYPGKVPPQWLIPGLGAKGDVPVNPFVDIAGDLNINTNDRSGGSIVDDFDNDGFLDIVTSAWGLDDPMHYYHNNGDGTFSNRSRESGLSDITGGLNLTSTDYNNDGFLDIFVLRGAWQGQTGFGDQPRSLLRNNGDGTFTDVTVESGLLSFQPTQTATWNDFNNDGWLDVFIGNETSDAQHPHPCELYLNNKNGTFTKVTGAESPNIVAFVKGVVSGDYDKDGWPDLFVSTLNAGQILLHNKGVPGRIPAFENVSKKAGFGKEPVPTFPTGFFDYDNDGWLDIFVCNYDFNLMLSGIAAREALHPSRDMAGKVYIYRNNGNGTFTDVTPQASPNVIAFAMGAGFGDIDYDGYLDLYLGTGNPNYRSLVPNRLFKNLNGKKFVDVTVAARVGNLQKGHGVSLADIDNDGDLDIHEDMGGAFRGDAYFSALYMNPGQGGNHWIYLKLEGTTSNRAAVGARVTLTFRENGVQRMVYREVNTGASFGCSPLRREIGIGKAETIDEIRVVWPASGKIQVFNNVKPGQLLLIREDRNDYSALPLHKLVFKKADGTIPMCAPAQ